jgi:hypothetical protein
VRKIIYETTLTEQDWRSEPGGNWELQVLAPSDRTVDAGDVLYLLTFEPPNDPEHRFYGQECLRFPMTAEAIDELRRCLDVAEGKH